MLTYQLRLAQTLVPNPYSIFPKLTYLLDQRPYAQAILRIAPTTHFNDYRNITDFVFVKMFPEWKYETFRYYEGTTVSLKDNPRVTPILIKAWDSYLCKCVDCAKVLEEKEMLVSWKAFRLICLTLVGGATLSFNARNIRVTPRMWKELHKKGVFRE